tara:strand:+ start:588 stop:731 length:144 start_codon:yes stop_codon:yes gene_type:complete
MSFFISLALIHWGFATGGLLAMKTDWSIPRFLIIVLLIKYFLLSYGI